MCIHILFIHRLVTFIMLIDKLIVQPDMLYGVETVPMTSSHVKQHEVTDEYNVYEHSAHTKRPCDKL